jgi:hypothetical protein
MGAVYEALDRDLQRHVALKTLLRFDANGLYLFKQEFRTLADVHHRNLVRLHELVQPADGPVFFTMELVAGVDFVAHIRGPSPGAGKPHGSGGSASSSRTPESEAEVTKQLHTRDRDRPPSVYPAAAVPHGADLDRLRPALRQLVEGLRALHTEGKLHRDIKPSNVLVTPEARVVILDFGVALELSRASKELDQGIVGTPAYMSPEQAMNEPLTPASDWYAVGVVLYKALTGRTPFLGSALDVVTIKATQEPPPPSVLVSDVPRDLEELAVDLLRTHPGDRPDAREILERLGAIRGARSKAPSVRPPRRRSELVGREAPLRALREAFDLARGGHAVTMRVAGGAGMGKSALVGRFLDDLDAAEEAEILSGRAYERETVPYKGIDSVVDALTRLLALLEESGETVPTPRHASALLRLFPVLRRVPSLQDVGDPAAVDPERVRQRAFRALGELLTFLARRRPTVVYVDDVQWADVDSAALLAEIMRPAWAPPLLVLMTYREEEAETSAFLAAIGQRWPAGAEVREVSVGPLGPQDAERFALERVGASDEASREAARTVARESKGSPLLIEELARSQGAGSARGALPAGMTLARVVSERLARLPAAGRALAELTAVGGRPLPLATLSAACEQPAELEALVEELRKEGLVQPGLREGRDTLEPRHDRIRELIVAGLAKEVLRERHARLARALEATAAKDLEGLAVHLLGAGESERGAGYAAQAADGAAAKLAFDRAAQFYRLALDAHPRSAKEARPLRVKLATALQLAWRCADAAEAYREAARDAPPLERINLERAAADQLLSAGRIDQGADAMLRVMAAFGLKAPRTSGEAVASLLWNRLMLRLRGLQFESRSPEQVSPEDRARGEVLATMASQFSVVDVVLAASMQMRFFRHALAAGDHTQVLRAAMIQMTHFASQGGPISRMERETIAIVDRLEKELDDPQFIAAVAMCRGTAAFHRGRWKEAEAILHEHAMRAVTHIAARNGRLFDTHALYYLGRLRDMSRRAERFLADAERRGDVYTAVYLRASAMIDVGLAADNPDGAREHLRTAMSVWSQRGFHVQHWYAMSSRAKIALYAGDGAEAYAQLEQGDRELLRSHLTHNQVIREATRYLRGRVAVAAALGSHVSATTRRARLQEARELSRRLHGAGMTWTAPLASLLQASAANAEGDVNEAIEALREAIDGAAAADMAMHAAAARRQLGILLGGAEGEQLRQQADKEMVAEGVCAPTRYALLYAPGRWDVRPRA